MFSPVLGALFDLSHPARYLHWHFFQMSVANVVVIALMIAVFIVAIADPVPEAAGERPALSDGERQMWTTWVRERALGSLPPEKLLPDRQPSYVSSWIYVFGVAAIASLVVVVLSGMILGLKGPEWWHVASVGRFFNGIHLWAVELFFFTMVVHLWGKFFMGAWRGGRGRTWVTGAIAFLVAIGAAFTGYLSQQNFDSQWIASEGKDGLNSVGVGAFFNVADFGQMYTFHVILLPVVVVALVDRARAVGPPHRGGAALPGPGGRRRQAAGARGERGIGAVSAPASPDPAAPWPGPFVRYDLVKELAVALAVDRRAGGAADDPLLLARRFADDDPELGAGRPGRLRRHRGHRAGRGPASWPNTARPTTTRRKRRRRSAHSTCRAPPASASRSTRRRTS